MPLSLAKFQTLTLTDQLGTVLHQGTYLARRYEEDVINPYYLDGLFVEVYCDAEINHLYRCYGFRLNNDRLADFATYVGLKELGE